MSSRLIIIGGICAQDPAQVYFTEHDHMVEAFPADRANKSLNVSILPGRSRCAGFRSIADAWADTTTPRGRLMPTVLGGLAEFERELIKARTDEGRKRAQARGVRFGRKLKLTPHQRQEALARRAAGEALVEIGRSYNVSHSTISRL
jgi:hypothetical protein